MDKKFSYADNLVAPTNMQIELTDSCNEKCLHCYNTWQVCNQLHSCLTEDNIVLLAKILSENKVFSVALTGGEPLLKKKIVEKALQEFVSRGINVSLNTNLTLMDFESAKKYKDLGLKSILTSIISHDSITHDFVTQKKGSHEMFKNGVKNALDAGLDIGASMVLTQYNKNHVFNTGEFVKNLGIKKFFVTRGSFPLDMPNFKNISIAPQEIYTGLYDLLKVKERCGFDVVNILECYPMCFLAKDEKFGLFSSRKCSAGITSATVGTDMQLRPCSHSNKKYGDLSIEPFDVIRQRMEAWRNGDFLPDKCKSCESVHVCTGGCRMDCEGRGNIRGMDELANVQYIDNIPNMLKSRSINSTLDISDKRFRMNKNIIVREESNGYMIGKGLSILYVSKDSGKLVKYLQNQQKFNMDIILEKYSIPREDLNNFLFFMYKQNLIEIEK